MSALGCSSGRVRLAAGVALFLCGCVETIDEEHSRIGDLLRDCVVPLPAGVSSWGAPVSLEYADGSVWIFESATLEDGADLRNVFALVPTADAACTGSFDLARDDGGEPISALALTSEEVEANAARSDGRRLDLVPIGGFVSGHRGFLYYEERLSGPGIFDSEPLGQGLCLFEDGATAPCTRVVRDDTTRLWDSSARPLNRGGFVDGEGFALVYGCQHVAAFEDLCVVARVPVDEVGDPAAYRFFNPFSGWIEDPANAGVLLNNAGQLTVRWNPYRREYTAIAMNIWESCAVVYGSSDPTGPFEEPDVLFEAVKPASLFVSGGVEHVALGEGEGRTIHVSYHTNAEGPGHGLHLASYRFLGRSE